MPTMAGARITILVIEVVLVALVQTATARDEQHTSLTHWTLKRTDLTLYERYSARLRRLDVAAGQFSVFSEVSIKDGDMNGYVKPMFRKSRGL